MDEVTGRFLSLAKRELSADDVRLLARGEAPPRASNALVARLPDGRHVVASFAVLPEDAEALARRLGILVATFANTLEPHGGGEEDDPVPPSERVRNRPPVSISLHEELKALAVRAGAHDVVVIDGDSPVLWGCASLPARPRARSEMLSRDLSDHELSSHDEPSAPSGGLRAVPDAHDSEPAAPSTAPTGILRIAPPPEESAAVLMIPPSGELPESPDPAASPPALTRSALAAIRGLPSLELLRKGRHLRHASRERDCYLVLSFSSIYLLCLVFDGEFDELRAERAAHESLPRIERLVLALPPLDPDPQPVGGVVALSKPRRR